MQVFVKGHKVLIDKSDIDFFNTYSWHIVNGYVVRSKRLNEKIIQISMHNNLMNPPIGYEVDHINRNKLDNRRSNLRIVTHAQNCQNRRKSSRNTSGFIGIRKKKGRNKWEVQVTVMGKHYYVGYFSDIKEAVRARDTKALELHGEYAQLNKSLT